jgi:hypothetical protein
MMDVTCCIQPCTCQTGLLAVLLLWQLELLRNERQTSNSAAEKAEKLLNCFFGHQRSD